MSNKNSNVLAIGIMFFLFAMISFVTGLQNPMGVIVKTQFGATNAMSQLGNLANFIAYAFMGLPAGFILKKYGYKITALAAVAVGFIGVFVSFISGVVELFPVYLIGAFISGFSMCMLNTVVNPMLNTLGGGGNKGNQLIQLGGSLNSLAATIVPVFVGYLMGDVASARISDANPALFIAMVIFALAFVIIFFSAIPEPELEAAKAALMDGSLQVFHTANFQVDGVTLDSYMADVDTDPNYEGDTEVIAYGVFCESAFRSAPYFDLKIDGINLLDVAF